MNTKKINNYISDMDDRTVGKLLVLPLIGLILLIFVYPILTGFWYSVNDVTIFDTSPDFVGVDHYQQIVVDPTFHNALINTLIYVIFSTIGAVILGLGVGLLLNRDFRGRGLAIGLLLLPYVLPMVAVVLLFRWTFNGLNGVANYIFIQVGLLDDPAAFFANDMLAMPTLILTTAWRFYPFVALLVLAKLQSIPSSYYESAETMGASMWYKFRHITLPQLRNVLLIAVFLRMLFIFNLFDIVWLGTGGGPGRATETLPILAYRVTFAEGSLGAGSAIAAITFFVLLFGVLIYIKIFGLGEVETT